MCQVSPTHMWLALPHREGRHRSPLVAWPQLPLLPQDSFLHRALPLPHPKCAPPCHMAWGCEAPLLGPRVQLTAHAALP